jgi:hypothetical protein
MVTVFLSATTAELAECRTAVYQALEGLSGYHCIRMEDFGSGSARPDEFCRARVVECDLFICLAGPLYGSVTEDDRSFTEAEYDAATAHDKPRLSFLTTEDFPVPARLYETLAKRRKQHRFRKRLQRESVIDTFSNSAELATKVIRAVRNWESAGREDAIETAVLRFRANGSRRTGWRDCKKALVRIGRNPFAEMAAPDDVCVSWEHGYIIRTGGYFYYRHLSETNATRIRSAAGERILRPGDMGETLLHDRDRITAGTTTWEVELRPAPEAQPSVPTAKEDQGNESK